MAINNQDGKNCTVRVAADDTKIAHNKINRGYITAFYSLVPILLLYTARIRSIILLCLQRLLYCYNVCERVP